MKYMKVFFHFYSLHSRLKLLIWESISAHVVLQTNKSHVFFKTQTKINPHSFVNLNLPVTRKSESEYIE